MNWRIAEAKQKFSQLIRATGDAPQMIYHRDRLVAAVVEAGVFQEFLRWQREERRPSLAEAAARVRKAFVAEGYVLEVPERKNRPNPFADALDDLPR